MLLQQHPALFICPICRDPLALSEHKSMLCSKGHCFDIAKSGYLNFFLGKSPADYPKDMLVSRQVVIKAGFFDPLLAAIVEQTSEQSGYVLDAGCGEGSLLSALLARWVKKGNALQGVGLDISKDGILLASRRDKNTLWVVGDLANLPLRAQSIALVLNILSPANYHEFKRVQSAGGRVLKVVPGRGYLAEIRNAIGKTDDYSAQPVLDLFHREFPTAQEQVVSYQFPLTPALLPHILAMTPLTWRQDQQALLKALQGQPTLSLAFTIIHSG